MQQQRRQQRHRHRVTPIERPVKAIEGAVEREGERAEERDAEPEEMQGRLIARPPQADRRADQQRKQTDCRQDEIHRRRAGRGRQRDFQCLLGPEPDEGVVEACPGVAAVLVLDDVRRRLDGRAVDGDEDVAALDAGHVAGRARHQRHRRNAFGASAPVDAVLDLVPLRAHRDVGKAQHDEDRDNRHGHRRTRPDAPRRFGGLQAGSRTPGFGDSRLHQRIGHRCTRGTRLPNPDNRSQTIGKTMVSRALQRRKYPSIQITG